MWRGFYSPKVAFAQLRFHDLTGILATFTGRNDPLNCLEATELMSSDYGLQIGQALKAVARLHADTSKLLVDCDKQIGKERRSLFGNYATRDLSYNVKADFWMPEGVFRYYDAGSLAVDTVTVIFFLPARSGGPEIVPQPIFAVGRIQYADGTTSKDADVKSICNAWDLWWLFLKSGSKPELGTAFHGSDLDNGRIAWARWIAIPLVSISSIEGVTKLFDEIAGESSAATE